MRQTLLSTVIYALLCASGIAGSNTFAAEETAPSFLITQTSRHDALIELATKSGREILFSYGATPKDKIEPFESALTLEDSLKKLLEGTDLRYTMTGNQIRIMRVGQEFSRLPPVTVLGYLRSSNNNLSEGDDTQERFPLYQVPLSIQSVSNEYIEEVQAREIEDVLNYLGGVEYLNRSGGINAAYYSRGIATPFALDGKFYRRTALDQDPALIERIDLIQGPSANFLVPGGVLNFVTKKPEIKSRTEFKITSGSNEFYRAEFDLNANKGETKLHGLRLIGVLENTNHFKERAEKDKYIFAPSFAKEFKNGSQLFLNGSYSYRNETANTTTIHEDFLPKPLPRKRLLTLPWAKAETEESHAAIDFKNLTLGAWRFNAGANWYLNQVDNSPVTAVLIDPNDPFLGPLLYTREGDALLLRINTDNEEVETFGIDTAIERSLEVFNINTLLRIGFDFQDWNLNRPTYTDPLYGNTQPVDPGCDITLLFLTMSGESCEVFNIYDPNYDVFIEPDAPSPTGKSKQLTDFYGLFISQNYYFSDFLTLHLDLKYEEMFSSIAVRDSQTDLDWKLDVTYKELTPQIGFNLSFNENFSSHVSYAESFSAQGVADANTVDNYNVVDGKFVGPSKARQLEIALKSHFFDSKLKNSITFYRIKVSNLQYIYEEDGDFFNGRLDDQFSTGFSFNINGELSDSLDLIFSYAFNETETAAYVNTPAVNMIFTQEPQVELDKTTPGTAKSNASAWLSYDSNIGAFKNFEFGLGLKYVGDRYGNDINSFRLPSYSTAEVVARYSGFEDIEVAFVVDNLWNEEYYKGSLGGPTLVEEGEPLTFYLTLKSKHNF